jgi:predicted phosphodiesterase
VPQRVLVLSDLHLGRPRCAALSARALRPLWDGIDHLVLNGDVAEVHHPRHWRRAAHEVLELFDLAETSGVALTLLSGNHDPYLSDLRHLRLAEGNVFVTHGDVLHPAVAPWSPAAARMRAAHEHARAALDPALRHTLESRLSVSQHAAFAEWEQLRLEAGRSTIPGMLRRPWALAAVLRYWRRAPQLAADFVAAHGPEARFVLIGHTHRPGYWRRNGRTIINTGSFGFPGRPWGVVIDRELVVRAIRLRRGEYRFEPRPVATFALSRPAHDQPELPLPDGLIDARRRAAVLPRCGTRPALLTSGAPPSR